MCFAEFWNTIETELKNKINEKARKSGKKELEYIIFACSITLDNGYSTYSAFIPEDYVEIVKRAAKEMEEKYDKSWLR